MENKARLGPQFTLRKCHKKERSPWDLISLLPDEILGSVLNVFSVKEAATTSVLSSRWVDLWKCTSRLDFDATNTLTMLAHNDPELAITRIEKSERLKLLKAERNKYVEWVNKVLRLHKGSRLEEFRVCLDLNNVNQHDIDNWVRFAFERSVQKLELDFATCSGLPHHGDLYILPTDLFAQTSLFWKSQINQRSETFCRDAFKSLISLCLKCVSVTDEGLHCFLSHCPNLERLVVIGSESLVYFEVSGQSLMLRHLEISYCPVKFIKISDFNLVSFTYLGSGGVVTLHNLPSLVEVRFGITRVLDDVIKKLSFDLSQVEILTLETHNAEEIAGHKKFPILTRLKQLVLVVDVCMHESLMGFALLLKASPCLQKFVLETRYLSCKTKRRKSRKPKSCQHHNLRVVELAGYSGRATDLEAAEYILENAVALEHLIINSRDPKYVVRCGSVYRGPIFEGVIKSEAAAKKLAKEQLEGKVPSHVRLSIV